MKALIFEAPHQAVVTEIADPKIGPDEVLVKSHAVGICHADFELYEGRYIIPVSYPIIPGHEWSGEVVETGSAVRGLAPGDAVVGECVVGPAGRVDDPEFPRLLLATLVGQYPPTEELKRALLGG